MRKGKKTASESARGKGRPIFSRPGRAFTGSTLLLHASAPAQPAGPCLGEGESATLVD